MKTTKILFLLSLLIIVIPLSPLKILVGGILPFPKSEISSSFVIYIFTVGILISSYFLKNKPAKRFLENFSMVLSAIFYRLLVGEDLLEHIPLIFQLPFLISFGLFLYFKLKDYFNRDLKKES